VQFLFRCHKLMRHIRFIYGRLHSSYPDDLVGMWGGWVSPRGPGPTLTAAAPFRELGHVIDGWRSEWCPGLCKRQDS